MDLKDITSIHHPTERPNFSKLWLPQGLTVFFSYETPIGFSTTTKWVTVQNNWGPTTGKHLTYIDNGAHSDRLPYDEFGEELAYAMGRRRLANGLWVWR